MKQFMAGFPRARAACLSLALAGITVCASGCYTRVIDAKGIGADQQHPRQSEATKPLRARDFWGGSDEKDKK
ncbi:MAG: hypothetical protein DHS20C14_19980 [Phycisphaeraceae bacterium]|nr:MAG: hypothetical protein DHS20C14_19980 [Phycisphaeraceae bacterium]